MACVDGAPNVAERACVIGFVGVDVAAAEAWRVYRPREAGAPRDLLSARRVLERMARVASCDRDDGVVDDSERALLATYARAFDVDDAFVARLWVEVGVDARGGVLAWLSQVLSTPVSVSSFRRRRSSSSSSSSSVVVRPWEVR